MNTEEFVEVDLDSDGNILAPKNDKIALIDADTLVYISCLNCQYEVSPLPWEMEEAQEKPNWNEDLGVWYDIDLDEVYKVAKNKIQKILDKTGCKDYELHFTDNTKTNFRYTFYPDYKANRKNIIRPAGLAELKELLVKDGKSYTHQLWEADDIVVMKKRLYPDNYILVAVDKDVLNAIEGKHFNYYESTKYNIQPKWIEIEAKHAKMWPYYQTIIGDKSDNIIGPKGIGPKRAAKFVNENMTEKEMWEGVVKAYESKGLAEFDAILNMNLVNMNLLDEKEDKIIIRKWQPNFNDKGEHIWN